MADHTLTSRYSVYAEAILAGALVGTVLALGGASDGALFFSCVLPPLALLLAAVGARRQRQPLRLPQLTLPVLLAAGFCLVQLIPVPLPILRVMSPMKAELVQFALEPLGLSTFRSISIDPPSTLRELAKAVGCASALVTASQISRSRRARRRLLRTVSIVGGAVALVGAVHAALGLNRLFGVYAFSNELPVVTFFGNPNHLAGFLTLTATVTLGLLLDEVRAPWRIFYGSCYLLSGTAVALSLSRAGICFFGLALLLFAIWAFARAPRPSAQGVPHSASWRRGLLAVSAAAAVLVLAIALGLEQLSAEYHSADSVEELGQSKVALWPAFARAAWQYWRAGMGRGTFGLGYLRWQETPLPMVFTHPENLFLQLFAEVGLVPALLLMAYGAYALAQLYRLTDLSWADKGALLGGLAVILHNLFDFSLELPAVPLGLAVALGVVSRPREEGRSRSFVLSRPQSAAAVGMGLSALALALSFPSYRAAEEEVGREWSQKLPLDQLEMLGKRLIDRHPADGLLYAGMGWAHLHAGRPVSALAWLNRALWLEPNYSPAHRGVARALLQLRRRSQAFAEYQLALSSSVGTLQPGLAEEALGYARTEGEILALCPKSPRWGNELGQKLYLQGRHKEALQLVADLVDELPQDRETALLHALMAGWKRTDRDYEGAGADIRRGMALDPENPVWAQESAALLSAQGKPDEAIAILKAALEHRPSEFGLWIRLGWAQLAAKRPLDAISAVNRARPFAVSLGWRKAIFLLEANAFQSAGRTSRAVESARSLVELDREDPQSHYLLAGLYELQGHFDEAQRQWSVGISKDAGAGKAAAKQRLDRVAEKLQVQRIEHLGSPEAVTGKAMEGEGK